MRESKRLWWVCHPNYNKEWRTNHPHYDREWRAKHPHYQDEWNKKHLNRPNGNATRTTKEATAQVCVYRHPELLDSKCEFCDSSENLMAHHPDYDYPKIIVTCCASCHNYIHKGKD